MKKLAIAVVGLGAFAPGALAASHFVKVTPNKVAYGKTITVSGSVGNSCRIGHKNDAATIYSQAFAGATKHTFHGVPAVSASLAKSHNGSFSIKVTLSKKLKTKSYTVTGHCGSTNFGSTQLKVGKPAAQGQAPGYGFY